MTSQKPKILHINDVAYVASTLVSGLTEMGVDAELYSKLNWNINKLPGPARIIVTIFARFMDIIRLKQYLHKEKFDALHVHYGSFA